MNRRGIEGTLATGLAAACLCAAAGDASAADFFVTSGLDDNSGGTLREQVDAAGNGDTVIINPGVNPLLDSGVEITVDADITIRGQGAGATTVDAQPSTVRNRAFNVQAGVTATIESLRITGGRAPNGVTLGANGTAGDGGGGIRSSGTLTLDSVLIEDCRAGNGGNGGNGGTGTTPTNGGNGANGGGGGAVSSGSAGLTVIDSTFSDNRAGAGGAGGVGGSDTDMGGTGAGGGSGSAGGGGGAISTSGNLIVTGSTFEGNLAGDGGAGGPAGNAPAGATGTGGPGAGGGAGGALSLGGAVTTIANSTFTGNGAGAGGDGGFGPASAQLSGIGGRGGGIATSGTVTVTHATIAGNAAGNMGVGVASDQGRGGGIHVLAGTTTARNSILSANTAPVTSTASCNNTVGDGGNNMAPAGEGCAGFATGNPMLSALADNGGPTETMAISAAGAAHDAVAATGENCTATDQRGFVRPQGAACDIGAFEITVPALLTVAKAGGGTGVVTGPGINCGGDCTETVPFNSGVVLTAVATAGSAFAGWSGCDSASGATCTQTLGSNETVTASFALVPVVTPPIVTPPAVTPKRCKKGQKLKKGKCVRKKRKKR